MSGKRIDWIDTMKGFAICCVVLSHCIYGENISGIFSKICLWVFSFYMSLFFAASGFFLDYFKPADFSLFIRRRFRSLMIPYLIWGVIIGLSVSYVPSILRHETIGAANLLFGILTFQASSSGGWFLQVLFFIYLLEYALSKLTQKTRFSQNQSMFMLGSIHIIFYAAGFLLSDTSFGELFRISKILSYSLSFWFGRTLYLYLIPKTSSAKYIPVYILFSLSFSYLTYHMDFNNILFSQICHIISTASGIIGEFMLFQWLDSFKNRSNNVFQFFQMIGKDTITVLCTHQILLILVHKLENMIGLYRENTYPLFLTFFAIMLAEIILIRYPPRLLKLSVGKYTSKSK